MTPEGAPVVLPWPPRPPRRIAGIPTGLLVCWQVALLLALVAIGRPVGHVIVLGVGAAMLIAATGMRPGGRWMHEWVALRLRYLLRGLRVPASGRSPELALLDLAAGVEAIEDVEIEGHEAAVIFHAAGGTAVLELDLDELGPDQAQLPWTLVPLHDHDPDAPAVCLQLLLHTTPDHPVRAWLAVQVRREAGFRVEELRSALVSTVRRLRRRLRADGRSAPTLDRAGLLDALRATTHLGLAGPVPQGDASGIGTEQWHAWWTRGVPQTSLAIRHWSGAPESPSAALRDTLLCSPGMRTISIAAHRTRLPTGHGAVGARTDVVATELLVRVAGPDRSTLEAATRQLSKRLEAAGASVERLDGRQLPGLAATLPLGGFLPGYAPTASAFGPAPRKPRQRPEPPSPAISAQPAPTTPAEPAPTTSTQPAPTTPAAPAPTTPAAPAPTTPAAPAPTTPAAPAPVTSAVTAMPTEPVAVAPQPAATDEPETIAGSQTGVDNRRSAAKDPTAGTQPVSPHAQAQPLPPPPPVPPAETAPVHPAGHPPAPPATAEPARGRSPVPAAPAPREPANPAGPPRLPTVLRGAAAAPAPVEALPPTVGGPPPPSYPGAAPAPYQPTADPHSTATAYGAHLFTADSPHRAWAEQLVTLTRTAHPTAQTVSVLASKRGIGTSTTAAGLARTLDTLRGDSTTLLSLDSGSAHPSVIQKASRGHAFTVVDLGAHTGEVVTQALTLSTRVVVVTSADRHTTATTGAVLDHIQQVRPALVDDAVVAVVCTTGRQYRRVSRELSDDLTPQAAQIVPIPPDPALRAITQPDLARLQAPTREAYLRLAASLASHRPAAAGTEQPVSTH